MTPTKPTRSFVFSVLFLGGAGAWIVACSSDAERAKPCVLGSETCDCRPGRQCDPGLNCLSNLCVRVTGAATGPDASLGADAAAGDGGAPAASGGAGGTPVGSGGSGGGTGGVPSGSGGALVTTGGAPGTGGASTGGAATGGAPSSGGVAATDAGTDSGDSGPGCPTVGETVVSGREQCCPLLNTVSLAAPLSDGTCPIRVPVGTSYCANCGDDLCLFPENKCNCAADCPP